MFWNNRITLGLYWETGSKFGVRKCITHEAGSCGKLGLEVQFALTVWCPGGLIAADPGQVLAAAAAAHEVLPWPSFVLDMPGEISPTEKEATSEKGPEAEKQQKWHSPHIPHPLSFSGFLPGF